MEQRDQLQELHKDDIRAKIAAGAASLRAGNSMDGEGVFARIDDEIDAAERHGRS